ELALTTSEIDLEILTVATARVGKGRSELTALQTDIVAPVAASKARLDKFGDLPKPTDPAESPDITAARKAEGARFSALAAIRKETDVQIVRADTLFNQIGEQRRQTFTRRLTTRVSSIFSPGFWIDVAADVPRFANSVAVVAGDTAKTFLNRV